MKLTKIRFLTVALLGLTSKALANPAFAVAPDRMHVQLNQTKTYMFIVKNTGDQLVHLRIAPKFYSAQSRALAAGTLLIPKKAEAQHSLIPYTIISPQVLSLEPTQQRDVRISIQAPKNAKPGTYREHITVKMLEVAQHYTSEEKANGKHVGVNLNLLLQIAPVVYADSGTNQAKLAIQCARAKNGTLRLNTTNTTPWHFSGDIKAYALSNSQKPLFSIKQNIFRETKTVIHTKWKPKRNTIKLIWRNDFNEKSTAQSTTCHLN